MEVRRSAFYRYLHKKSKPTIDPDIKLIIELKALHKMSKKSYGSRRMAKALSEQGGKTGRFKARRLMRQNGIACKQRRRYKITTKNNPASIVADNILNRNFCVEKPNSGWVSDITCVWTAEGWLYLAAVLDLFARRVVGYAMADNTHTDLIEKAFVMAKSHRRPLVGFLHHSDRGSQYTSQQYQQRLNASGAIISMSRKGNCWDNAVMERFFGSLKSERTEDENYATRAEAKADIIDYIETFYNKQRLHSTLNYMSPMAYEKAYERSNKNKAII